MSDDTTEKVKQEVRKNVMARSAEERFLMGVSSCEAARTMVYSSFDQSLSEREKVALYFKRMYKNDFSAEKLEEIYQHLLAVSA